ncbi:hypothetical protein [Nitrosospira multiformis]|uniref:hypothetical protein n=1 Tax=Nitrosospira multiformis TaxID=1231 RepID=UPI000941CDF3|nr:hypothetical protein [Nitrosospira multiformis]
MAALSFLLETSKSLPPNRCSKNRHGCKISKKFALQELQMSKFSGGLDQQHFSSPNKAANRIIFVQLLYP